MWEWTVKIPTGHRGQIDVYSTLVQHHFIDITWSQTLFDKMASKRMADFYMLLTNCVICFALFVTCFFTYLVHNVAATVSYDRKYLLAIRTVITQHELEEAFSSNEKDILLSREQAQIPVICMKKRRRKRGRRSSCLLRIRRRASKLPLPSVLLANMQSLENKIDDLRLSYQWDIKNCNILYFTELWLNDDTDNIELAGFSMHRQNREEATSGKTRVGGLFVNNSWCAMLACTLR